MNTVTRIFAPLALAVTATAGMGAVAFPDIAAAAELTDRGSFRGADSSHPASGTAEVIRLRGGGFGIKLHDDFRVRGGPDLRVWLSDASNPRNAHAVRGRDYVDLGRLKSSSGEQIYRLPADVDLSGANSVVIWCRAFGVFFGSATLS
ncbi:DM13 domain-containing protein [Aurantiacibacter aquimixticola]|nr:DM13 domain-containing protein [Aurantiacibacter aquimixticola]